MTDVASRDQNFVPTLLGVSTADGTTPVKLYANPTTHRLLVDLAGGGSGTVTDVSVVTANGFSGSVATSTTTPAITLATTVTGLLKGNGTAISAGVAGDVDTILPTQTGNGGKYLTTNGTVSSWGTIAAGGDVSKVGTPANDQVGVWTGDGTIEGTAGLTFASNVLGVGTAANGTVQSNGNFDLILQTGNVTTGNITITDGANGNITIDPNGSGNVVISTTGGAGMLLVGDSASTGIVSSNGAQNLILETNTGTNSGVIQINDGTNGNIELTPNGTGAVVVSTSLIPDANDGAVLGAALTGWSDLFLASGAVIGWDNGNILLTHSAGTLTTSNTATGATGPILEIYQDSSSPAANDDVGTLMFSGRDSANNKQEYARIEGTIVSPTSTTEEGKLTFFVTAGGAITSRMELDSSLRPVTNDAIPLGSATVSWSDLFLASTGVINWANGNATLTHTTGLLTSNVPLSLGTSNAFTTGTIELGAATDTTISRSAAGVIAVEGVVIPSISSTNTLTNKRITKRVGTTTSSATPTINTDDVDFYSLTAQTADITSFTTNLSGTPTDGQTLWIAITGTAARAITWGASFEASTVALPTTTVSTNRLDVGFVWNTATSKWRCIASA